MIILYTIGAIFGFIIAICIVLFIITRPEKNFDLDEESYELLNNQKNK